MQCGTSHLQTVHENILAHIILATYRKFTVATVRFTKCQLQYLHPPQILTSGKCHCNNASHNKSYWIHRVALTTELHLAPIHDMSNRTSVTLFIVCHYYYCTIIFDMLELSRVLSYSSQCKCNETPSEMMYSHGWTTTSYPGMTQTFLRRRHTHLVWKDGGL